MLSILTAFLLTSTPIVDQAWLNQVADRIDPTAVSWMKEQLRENLLTKEKSEKEKLEYQKGKCHSTGIALQELETPLYVCMSFSIPDETWVNLSKELDKVGGVFIIRGLPKNSFRELVHKIQTLSKLGVKTPIQIHPQLFKKHSVAVVPSFLITDKENTDKIEGNISLLSALEHMSEGGSNTVRQLRQQLQEARRL